MRDALRPIESLHFEAAELMRRHPPALLHPHKQLLAVMDRAAGAPVSGTLHYTRWPALPLPDQIERPRRNCRVLALEHYYDYAPVLTDLPAIEWHVNFADPNLFFGYGTGLFAQDEIQVAEHPALGALREALLADGHAAVTVDHGRPTPVLVSGIQRRLAVATHPDPAAGRPRGLYGNAFTVAAPAAIRRAVRPLNPPTTSHLLAMAAAFPSCGPYTAEQIRFILTTALTGFTAARNEACRLAGREALVAVHTGFWGCGAFGGSRVLMTLLQVLAATLAGLDLLAFHTVNTAGNAVLDQALVLLETMKSSPAATMGDVLDWFLKRNFRWGISDGN